MARPEASEPDPLRAALRDMWSSVAPNWVERADAVDERGSVVADALLDAAAVGSGDRVLELACGPGGVGLEAARRVGPTGTVTLSDVAPDMVAGAAARAAELGLGNVGARVFDLESIDLDDGSVDVVVCREGLMLVPDPVVAAGEMGRVVAPGGRVAVAVWGPREDNPWLGVLFDAMSELTGAPVPPEGIPGPFSLDRADRVEQVLVAGGLTGIRIRQVDVPLRCDSFDEWWSWVPPLAGPIANVLASLPPEAVDSVRATAVSRLEPFRAADGLVLPGVSLVASGHTP
ncbi:MAG: class I SAM-dependent methyltransferase [Microthrixaceae bacterium]